MFSVKPKADLTPLRFICVKPESVICLIYLLVLMAFAQMFEKLRFLLICNGLR